MTYTCVNCGNSFTGHKRKYCDKQCGRRYKRRLSQGDDLTIYEDKSALGVNKLKSDEY